MVTHAHVRNHVAIWRNKSVSHAFHIVVNTLVLNSPKANSATNDVRAEFAESEFSTQTVGC